MHVPTNLDTFRPPNSGIILTIGNFDGVHRGHQAILARARALAAARGAPVTAMTFEPHPSTVLSPHRILPRLTSPEEKLELLTTFGASDVLVLRSEPALFARPALEFLSEVVQRCRPIAFVEGPTFMFGRGREGSNQTLRDHATEFGYFVEVVDALVLGDFDSDTASPPPGNPPRQTIISSSNIRRAISDGHLELAAAMLGRNHGISGIVVAGDGRGASLGFPTANLSEILQLLPAEGVYAATAILPDEKSYLAAVNIGPQPTFGGLTSRVEAHLLEFSGDLVGMRLRLSLRHRVRGQQKFASAAELIEQITRDAQAVRALADG